MILSDVNQRRLIVKSLEAVKWLKKENKDDRIFDYEQVADGIYLVTLTQRNVGDYYKARKVIGGSILLGLAQEDIKEIEKTLKEYKSIVERNG